jgi:hypothetical protein
MSALEDDIEMLQAALKPQGDEETWDEVDRRLAVDRVIALAQQAERLISALQKIDAVYAAAHLTHGGHLDCDVAGLETELEDVRDLIGPAPEAPPAPVRPDTRSEAEKARAAEVFGVSTWRDLKDRKL